MMNNKYIVLDIETIPNQLLSDWCKEYVNKRIEKKRGDNKDPDKYCAIQPEMGQIVCISIGLNGEDFFVLKGDEKSVLSQFWDCLKDNIGYKIVGFNTKYFDIPYIDKRSCILNINNYNIDIPTKKYDKIKHYDLLEVLSNYNPYDGHTLEIYCKMYNVPYENIIDGSEIYTLYKKGDLDAIYSKCLNDVRATDALYRKVSPYL